MKLDADPLSRKGKAGFPLYKIVPGTEIFPGAPQPLTRSMEAIAPVKYGA